LRDSISASRCSAHSSFCFVTKRATTRFEVAAKCSRQKATSLNSRTLSSGKGTASKRYGTSLVAVLLRTKRCRDVDDKARIKMRQLRMGWNHAELIGGASDSTDAFMLADPVVEPEPPVREAKSGSASTSSSESSSSASSSASASCFWSNSANSLRLMGVDAWRASLHRAKRGRFRAVMLGANDVLRSGSISSCGPLCSIHLSTTIALISSRSTNASMHGSAAAGGAALAAACFRRFVAGCGGARLP